MNGRRLLPGRWTGVSWLSIMLGIAAIAVFIFGVATRQIRPLAFGAAGLGASFAGISVGWALDFKVKADLVLHAERARIRGMQIFFVLVVAACVLLTFLR